ncbi:MAG: AraC family transcriptional regulator [Epulopiscium sp.]|nr:AraC family transcriptional regulator [Candidatus Epulonipiscium sp.]
MLVRELKETLGLTIVAGENGVDKEITAGYVGDLLSWVMANAKPGAVWITIQSHVNIIAVASLLNLSCIIVAEGAHIDKDTIEKANEEDITVFSSEMNAYELVKKLTEIGID